MKFGETQTSGRLLLMNVKSKADLFRKSRHFHTYDRAVSRVRSNHPRPFIVFLWSRCQLCAPDKAKLWIGIKNDKCRMCKAVKRVSGLKFSKVILIIILDIWIIPSQATILSLSVGCFFFLTSRLICNIIFHLQNYAVLKGETKYIKLNIKTHNSSSILYSCCQFLKVITCLKHVRKVNAISHC